MTHAQLRRKSSMIDAGPVIQRAAAVAKPSPPPVAKVAGTREVNASRDPAAAVVLTRGRNHLVPVGPGEAYSPPPGSTLRGFLRPDGSGVKFAGAAGAVYMDRDDAKSEFGTLFHDAMTMLKGKGTHQLKAGEAAIGTAENRTGLPDGLKAGVESLSGMSMDGVQVHYNSSRPAGLGALAFTQGHEIHIAPGQERHLPHEAWHVVQQAQGRVQPTMQTKSGVAVNDDVGLEREAEAMGARASRCELTILRSHPPASKGCPNVAQRMRVSKSNSFYGPDRNPNEFSEDEIATVLHSLPAGWTGDPWIGMVRPPNRPLQWVEFRSHDIHLLQDEGRLLPASVEETADSDHGQNTPAPESPVRSCEILQHGFEMLNEDVLKRIFSALADSVMPGDVVSDNSRMQAAFDRWRQGGVMTRAQFKGLFGVLPVFGDAVQMARTGNTYSFSAGYQASSGQQYVNVVYFRDPDGNIDFNLDPSGNLRRYSTSIYSHPITPTTVWHNPQDPGSLVQLGGILANPRQGVMPSGKKVDIPTASRSQHFAIADSLYPNSRAGKWTWHHLTQKYEMVLVDMTVHAKHGHNGGVHLW